MRIHNSVTIGAWKDLATALYALPGIISKGAAAGLTKLTTIKQHLDTALEQLRGIRALPSFQLLDADAVADLDNRGSRLNLLFLQEPTIRGHLTRKDAVGAQAAIAALSASGYICEIK